MSLFPKYYQKHLYHANISRASLQHPSPVCSSYLSDVPVTFAQTYGFWRHALNLARRIILLAPGRPEMLCTDGIRSSPMRPMHRPCRNMTTGTTCMHPPLDRPPQHRLSRLPRPHPHHPRSQLRRQGSVTVYSRWLPARRDCASNTRSSRVSADLLYRQRSGKREGRQIEWRFFRAFMQSNTTNKLCGMNLYISTQRNRCVREQWRRKVCYGHWDFLPCVSIKPFPCRLERPC